MEHTKQTVSYEVRNQRALVTELYMAETCLWHQETHENGGTAAENVDDTLGTIEPESVMYEVIEGRETAAAFTVYRDWLGNGALTFFHVKQGFRTPEFLSRFWEEVRAAFGGQFRIGVYEKNDAAAKHLLRQGFEVERTDENRGMKILIFKSS